MRKNRCYHKNKANEKRANRASANAKQFLKLKPSRKDKLPLRRRREINEVDQELAKWGLWGKSGLWLVFVQPAWSKWFLHF